MEHGLRNNPSMKPFVPAMIKLAWDGARVNAATALSCCIFVNPEVLNRILREQHDQGDWNDRLLRDFPWSPIEIVGYDPDDDCDHLCDPRYLPFHDPLVADKANSNQAP